MRFDSNELFSKRLEIVKVSQDIEQKLTSYNQAKASLDSEKQKLAAMPSPTAQQLDRIRVLREQLARVDKLPAHLPENQADKARISKELGPLEAIGAAKQRQADQVANLTALVQKKETELQALLEKKQNLEKEATALQTQLSKSTTTSSKPKLPSIVIASSSGEATVANNIATQISDNLKKIDNLACQIQMLENAPDPVSRAVS